MFISMVVMAHAAGCLWDSDTFKEEALRKKDLGDIVTGRVRQHSRRFYEEKVTYTKRLIASGGARAERYDDLAVAHDRLGQFDEAIAVMDEKEKRFPGQYTTLANKGTFLAHKQDFGAALELLRAAIAKNPKAHFGRERYQVMAIEYQQSLAQTPELAGQKDLLGNDISSVGTLLFGDEGDFEKGAKTKFDETGLSRDVFVALAGIIQFGSGLENPHIWMALATVLAFDGDRSLAIRAAARAHHLGHARAKAHARGLSQAIREFAGGFDLKTLDEEFAKGQAEMAKAQADEDRKLAMGKHREVFGY
jgi:tetratricopeptide (TPR) repeat protein